MYRIIQLLCLCFITVLLSCNDSYGAWPWSDSKSLVTVNGISYTEDDYRRWWENWREPDAKGPQDLQPFIEWKLLVQEAQSMELDQMASFERKVQIFLKARARMMLKYDTVDSRIQITDQEVREVFERDYNPVRMLTVLYFVSQESADKAYKELAEDTLSFDKLLKRPAQEGGPQKIIKKEFYPKTFDDANKAFEPVKQFMDGEVSAPNYMGHYFMMYRLDELRPPDENEFKRYSQKIRNSLIEEQQVAFTQELIEALRKKYKVQVNDDLFALAAPDLTGAILEKPIVTTNRGDIPFRLLVKDIKNEYRYRPVGNWTDGQRKNLFEGLLNGMINEYLISWESLERHYEEQEPFKWTYQYYREARLIDQIEYRFVDQEIVVSESDIANYYEKHLEKYRDPDLVSFIMIEDEKGLIEKIWGEISQGGDFLEVAKKYYASLAPMKDTPSIDLAPQLQEVLEGLLAGETAPPYLSPQGLMTLVKMVNRKKGEPRPLNSVEEEVGKELMREKFRAKRKEFIERLLSQSEIKINRKAWERLKLDLANG